MTRKFVGASLGLLVSTSLMGMLGRSITLKSRKGAGSTFTLNPPVKMEN